MVIAQALYRVLSVRRGTPEIHVLAPAWSKPVLERMPEVTRAIELAAVHGKVGLGARRRLGRALRGEGYAQAIILPRSFKSALVPFLARIPRRTGFRGEWRYGLLNDMRAFDPRKLNQTVKRFVALGAEADGGELPAEFEPRLRVDRENLRGLEARLGLDGEEVVALMPGAEYGPAKQWPVEYFAELASRLAVAGAQVWVLGSAKERELGEAIKKRANHDQVHDLCGETTLGDVVDLLGAAKVAVSNDSGLMHIAAAVDTHVVAIFGSSSPGFTPPLSQSKDVLYLDLECSPCFQRQCPLGHLRCLQEISVDTVSSVVFAALETRASNGHADTEASGDLSGPRRISGP